MVHFREASDEISLQCISLLHEQKLAGKSYDEAFKHLCNVLGKKALIDEEAREIWMEDEIDESMIIEEHGECCAYECGACRACECGVFGPVITNFYEYGDSKCMTDGDWLKTAKRVIDGRYIFCRGRPEKAIILIDLFHKRMKT